MKTVCKQLVLFLVLSQCIIPVLWSMELEREETVPLMIKGPGVRYTQVQSLRDLQLLPPELIRLICTFLPPDHPAIPVLFNLTGINAREAQQLVKGYISEHSADPRPFFNARDYAALAAPIEKAWKQLNAGLKSQVTSLIYTSDVAGADQHVKQFLPYASGAIDNIDTLSAEQLDTLYHELNYTRYCLGYLNDTFDRLDTHVSCGKKVLEGQRNSWGIAFTICLYGILIVGCFIYVALMHPPFNWDECYDMSWQTCWNNGLSNCYFNNTYNTTCTGNLDKACQALSNTECSAQNNDYNASGPLFKLWAVPLFILGAFMVMHGSCLLFAKSVKNKRSVTPAVRNVITQAITRVIQQQQHIQIRLRSMGEV